MCVDGATTMSGEVAGAPVESVSDTGVSTYYQSKLDGLRLTLRGRQKNLRRLEAQRNELNAKGALSAPWVDPVAWAHSQRSSRCCEACCMCRLSPPRVSHRMRVGDAPVQCVGCDRSLPCCSSLARMWARW